VRKREKKSAKAWFFGVDTEEFQAICDSLSLDPGYIKKIVKTKKPVKT
jgi:hypothetical protein